MCVLFVFAPVFVCVCLRVCKCVFVFSSVFANVCMYGGVNTQEVPGIALAVLL